MKQLSRWIMSATVLGLFALGCEEPAEGPQSGQSEISSPSTLSKGPVIHRVSIGGADICEALGAPTGCDANFSLVAFEYADGSVSGQWEDSFGHGNGSIHVTVTCLSVVGNQAWVSGVIKHPKAFAGVPVLTRMSDNGTSANDPPDEISFSFFNPMLNGVPLTCSTNPKVRTNAAGDNVPIPLITLTHGQVKVR